MTRNLDHRIEVLAPIEHAPHREELLTAFDLLLKDTAGAWRLLPDGTWERIRPDKSDKPRSAQLLLARRVRRRAVSHPIGR